MEFSKLRKEAVEAEPGNNNIGGGGDPLKLDAASSSFTTMSPCSAIVVAVSCEDSHGLNITLSTLKKAS